MKRFAPLVALTLFACEPTGINEEDTVDLTLRLELRGGRDLGSTPGAVYLFADTVPVNRAFAFPQLGEPCELDTTPVTTCTFAVARGKTVSLVAYEPDPAIFVRFAPASPDDTVRDGRYVEFVGWTECPDRTERGLCVLRVTKDETIVGSFQLLQQVIVYQTGAATMDYKMFSAAPTLKLPAQNDNILDAAGCRSLPNGRCDAVRMMGGSPYHRFTAFVPRQTIVAMFSGPGSATEWVGRDDHCIESIDYGPTVCSFISPDTSRAPIFVTIRYTWWDCPSGVSDRDLGGCVYRDLPDGWQRRSGPAPGVKR